MPYCTESSLNLLLFYKPPNTLKMKLALAISALVIGTTAQAPTIYLIRHAEKNPDGTISDVGMQRAGCIAQHFGPDSDYNIQKIIVQTPEPGGKLPEPSWYPVSDLCICSADDSTAHLTQRPYNTTLPLANALNLEMDTSCNVTEMHCAANLARSYRGPGNVLIGWEHTRIHSISSWINEDSNPPFWPDDVFDWILNQPAPYNEVTRDFQRCQGLPSSEAL